MFNGLYSVIIFAGSHGGGHIPDYSFQTWDWDWNLALSEFREAAGTALYYLSLVTSWLLSNPWTLTILCISVMAAVFYLIRAAKDAVD